MKIRNQGSIFRQQNNKNVGWKTSSPILYDNMHHALSRERNGVDEIPRSSTFMPFQKIDITLALFSHQEFACLLPGYHNLSWYYASSPQSHQRTFSGPLGTSSFMDLNTFTFCKQSLTSCSPDVGCSSPFQAVLIGTEVWDQALLVKTQILKSIYYFCLFLLLKDKHFCWISFYY